MTHRRMAGSGPAPSPRNRGRYLGGLHPVDRRGVLESMRLQDQIAADPAGTPGDPRAARKPASRGKDAGHVKTAVCGAHMGAGVHGRADARLRSMDPTEAAPVWSSLSKERAGFSVHREYTLQSARSETSVSSVRSPRTWNPDRVAEGLSGGSTSRSSRREMGALARSDTETARPVPASATRRKGERVDPSALTPRQAAAEQLLKKLSMVPDEMYSSDDPGYDASPRTRDYVSAARILTHRSERRRQESAESPRADCGSETYRAIRADVFFADDERELNELRQSQRESGRGRLREGKECNRPSRQGQGAMSMEAGLSLQHERGKHAARVSRAQQAELLWRERDLEIFEMRSRGEGADDAMEATLEIPGGDGDDPHANSGVVPEPKAVGADDNGIALLSRWFNCCTIPGTIPVCSCVYVCENATASPRQYVRCRCA